MFNLDCRVVKIKKFELTANGQDIRREKICQFAFARVLETLEEICSLFQWCTAPWRLYQPGQHEASINGFGEAPSGSKHV